MLTSHTTKKTCERFTRTSLVLEEGRGAFLPSRSGRSCLERAEGADNSSIVFSSPWKVCCHKLMRFKGSRLRHATYLGEEKYRLKNKTEVSKIDIFEMISVAGGILEGTKGGL